MVMGADDGAADDAAADDVGAGVSGVGASVATADAALVPEVAAGAGTAVVPVVPVGAGAAAAAAAPLNARKPADSVRRSTMPGSPAGSRSMIASARSKAELASSSSFRSKAAFPSL